MEYKIITNGDWGELEAMVNERIKDGWKPQGGLSCTRVDGSFCYYTQAMIKEDDEFIVVREGRC
jgi:hypothetical protein